MTGITGDAGMSALGDQQAHRVRIRERRSKPARIRHLVPGRLCRAKTSLISFRRRRRKSVTPLIAGRRQAHEGIHRCVRSITHDVSPDVVPPRPSSPP